MSINKIESNLIRGIDWMIANKIRASLFYVLFMYFIVALGYESNKPDQPIKEPSKEEQERDMVRKYIKELEQETERMKIEKNTPKIVPDNTPIPSITPQKEEKKPDPKDDPPSGCGLVRCESA